MSFFCLKPLKYCIIKKRSGILSGQLFTRSHFSLLNGLMSIDELLLHAQNQGYTYLALTDYNVMYGSLEFYKKAKKAKIKPLFGLEVSIDDFTLVLLAKNNEGLIVLHHLSYKLSKQKTIDLADFINDQDDLIIILPSENGPFENALYENDREQIERVFKDFQYHFKTFYIGITHQESKFFHQANTVLKKHAVNFGVKCLAMPKIYYKNKEDHHAFRAMRAIDEGKILEDPSLTFAPDRHFLSKDEYHEIYDSKCIQNTHDVANLCHVDLESLKTDLPEYENSFGVENDIFLNSLSLKGLEKRLKGNVSSDYKKRLDFELNIINSMGFTNYFLVVYDIVRFAKMKGINVGPGRGSAAGSLVSYALGIIDVDPMAYNLMFERFLNPQRQSMPDIDIDFPDDRRDEVVNYIFSKYGPQYSAHIVAFDYLRARQSFRDCGRILNIPIYTINQATNLINHQTLMKTYNENKRFALLINSNKDLTEVFKLALKLEGKPRHISQHAAGIVVSEKPLLDVVPLVNMSEGVNATQYNMDYLEDIGLIKIDILGIRNLSIIDRIAKDIRQTDPSFSIQSIPYDDKKTFELIAKGETTGIFQLESAGMRDLIKRMKPHRFLDIVDTIALYRPGPMENIPLYLKNRQNPTKINYLHEDLVDITKDTFGVLVYQEQIMEVAQKIAGFSLARADILRRTMSDKDAPGLKALEKEFKNGALKNGYRKELADEIFDLILKFANYGFNKSHSVAYAVVAYQLSYLKANYPERFYTELLNSVIGADSKTKRYIDECQRLSVKLEVPSLNTSEISYTRHNSLIRLPFTIIKGISKNSAQKIVDERNMNGPYKSYVEAILRLRKEKINEKQMIALIEAGTFDIFGYSRASMKHNLQEVLLYASLVTIKDKQGETIFNTSLVSQPKIETVPSSERIELANEFNVLGFYLGDYPTKAYKDRYQTDSLASVKPLKGSYRVIVKVDRIKEHRAKNGLMMAFLAISDDTTQMDAVMFNNVYRHFEYKIKLNDIVLIKGNMKEEGSLLIQDFFIFDH